VLPQPKYSVKADTLCLIIYRFYKRTLYIYLFFSETLLKGPHSPQASPGVVVQVPEGVGGGVVMEATGGGEEDYYDVYEYQQGQDLADRLPRECRTDLMLFCLMTPQGKIDPVSLRLISLRNVNNRNTNKYIFHRIKIILQQRSIRLA
jgi:hypothetical protein